MHSNITKSQICVYMVVTFGWVLSWACCNWKSQVLHVCIVLVQIFCSSSFSNSYLPFTGNRAHLSPLDLSSVSACFFVLRPVQLLGANHPDVAKQFTNLAILCSHLGKYDEVRNLHVVFALQQTLIHICHTHTHTCTRTRTHAHAHTHTHTHTHTLHLLAFRWSITTREHWRSTRVS